MLNLKSVIIWLLLFYSLLDDEEIEYFQDIKLSHIIQAVTSIEQDEIQDNIFAWYQGDPCPQPEQLNSSKLDDCEFLKGYDYFQVRLQRNINIRLHILPFNAVDGGEMSTLSDFFYYSNF